MSLDDIRITVVTVTYNVEGSLRDTLTSVRQQTYPNIEMIIVDGNSSDGTLSIAREFEQDGAIVISEPDKGIYDAMNKGIRLSTGHYLNFMNAGDRFHNDEVVADAVKNMRAQPADYFYGDVMSSFGGEAKLSVARPPSYMWRNKPFNHQSLFASTRYLKQLPFDLKFSLAGDYHQTYNAYRAGAAFVHMPLVVADVDMSDGASKRDYLGTVAEKLRVNWIFAPSKARVLLFWLHNLPFLYGVYILQRLGIFNWIMINVGKYFKRRHTATDPSGLETQEAKSYE